eukprot:TRINITY_DN79281_c0_g1_i1.p2 TRINITY_DN79281_c0_g1~~TRINITY_DN79281_c0_g1_i1.p2  ORF type:complete len:246 (+),score=23.41 TRINITY_DN79281_c0_g1_i1:40-738(+)
MPRDPKKGKTPERAANKAAEKDRVKKEARREEYIKRARTYIKKYKAAWTQRRTYQRNATKSKTNYYLHPEHKVAFVVRIRGVNDIAPKPRKILQLLRLRQIFTGVFVRLNKSSLQMLNKVAPFIAWGYPSLAMTRKLVLKRGYLNQHGCRTRIQSNEQIERQLGKHDIICVDDIIHQLYTCGDKFRETNKKLWPFKLSNPNGGMKAKRKHFVEGGDYGNRETMMNQFIKQCL